MKCFLENSVASRIGRVRACVLTFVSATLAMHSAHAQVVSGARHDSQPVIVSGVVPDEATKAQLIAKARALYGSRVIDQLSIGSVIAPPNWSRNVQRILTDQLYQVKQGQLQVDGNEVRLRGQVANEAQRQQLVSQIATTLSSSYTVKDGLTVPSSAQSSLDRTLGNRIVEFDSGSANLRQSSKPILREIAVEIGRLGDRTVEIVGHTDNEGSAGNNLILSRARAEAVKHYLTQLGLPASQLTTVGIGSGQPVASNDSEDGRKRNRRIEFRITND